MMNTKLTLSLNSFDKVKNFCRVMNTLDAEADIGSGRYLVDAKSIMGIYSLNLMRPVDLLIYDQNKNYAEVFREFVAR